MGKVVWRVRLSKCRPISSEDGHTKTGMPSTILCQISVKCYGWPTIADRCKTVKLLGVAAAPIKTRATHRDTGCTHLSGKSSKALSQLCPLISDYSQTLMVLTISRTNNTARSVRRCEKETRNSDTRNHSNSKFCSKQANEGTGK